MSVGDPATMRQLPFGPMMYVDGRGEQNWQPHVACAQDDQQ